MKCNNNDDNNDNNNIYMKENDIKFWLETSSLNKFPMPPKSKKLKQKQKDCMCNKLSEFVCVCNYLKEINENMERLDSMGYEDILNLEEKVINCTNKANFKYFFQHFGMVTFDHTFDSIYERKKKLACDDNLCKTDLYCTNLLPYIKKFYEVELIMKSDEKNGINGYQLYDVNKNIMDFDKFRILRKLLIENKEISKDEFEKWFEHNGCIYWTKLDHNGLPSEKFNCESLFKIFKGNNSMNVYNPNTGKVERIEKDNPSDTIFNDNCNALWKLPYPKALVIEAIKISCNRGSESVRFCNFICEWIKRMNELVYDDKLMK